MDYFDFLQQVVSINSYTKNKAGIDNVGAVFDHQFQSIGYDTEVFQRELIGNHRYYISNYNPEKKRMLLLGHLDTVFPPGKFEEYKEDEKWVYGPGVCDMKGGNVVALWALKRLHEENLPIENVDVLLVSDEETGSDDSKLLTSELAKKYDYCFVYEAAGKNMEVVSARKGVGTFFIDIEGKAAHAGNHYSDGVDANLEAAYKIQELVKLTDLQKGTTVNVGKMEGGIGANTISPHAHLTFEIRYKVANERDRVLEAIERIVHTSYVPGSRAILHGGIQRDVMQAGEKTMDLVARLERVSGQSLPTEERGGVSDANIVSSAGVTTLDGFGPYGDGDHTVHERALKSSFESRIDLSYKLLRHFIKEGDF